MEKDNLDAEETMRSEGAKMFKLNAVLPALIVEDVKEVNKIKEGKDRVRV